MLTEAPVWEDTKPEDPPAFEDTTAEAAAPSWDETQPEGAPSWEDTSPEPAFLSAAQIEQARKIPSISATTAGGPRVSLPDEGVGLASLEQEGGVTGALFAGLSKAQEPIVGLQKRLGVTPEEVSGAMQAVGPVLSEAFGVPVAEAVRQMGDRSLPPTTGQKVFSGVQRGVIGGIEGLESPVGLATLGVGAGARMGVQAAKEALPAIDAAFALQMAASVPGMAKSAYDAIQSGDPEAAAQAITQGVLTGVFTAAAAKGAISALRQNVPRRTIPGSETAAPAEWSEERKAIFEKQRQAALDAQTVREKAFAEANPAAPAAQPGAPNAIQTEVPPPGPLPPVERQPAQPVAKGQAEVGAPQRGGASPQVPQEVEAPPYVPGLRYDGVQPGYTLANGTVRPPKWQFTLTEEGKQTTFYAEVGEHAETIAARRDQKLRDFGAVSPAIPDWGTRQIPILTERIGQLHNLLVSSVNFGESEFYDGSYPIPTGGGIIAARNTARYRSDPVFAGKVDAAVKEITDTMVKANRQRMALMGKPDTGSFGVDYAIEPEQKARATYGVNVVRAWHNEAKQKYPYTQYLGNISIREGFQNSLDAVLGAIQGKQVKAGQINITLAPYNRTGFKIEDNGIGMSDVDIGQKFLSLHSTGKAEPGRFGGFGIAKAVILGPADDGTWTLETRDNRFTHELAQANEVVQTVPHRQGTSIEVLAKTGNPRQDTILDADATRYVETTELPKNVAVTIDGQPVKSPFKGLRGEKSHVEVNDTTSYDMTYYSRPPEGYDRSYIIRLVDEKTGAKLTQSIRGIGEDGFRGAIVVDIATKAVPGDNAYPLVDSRMEMKWDAEKPVKKLIEAKTIDVLSARRGKVDYNFFGLQSRPEWAKTIAAAKTDVGYQKLVATVNKIWESTGGFFGSAPQRPFTPLDELSVKIDVGYKGNRGGTVWNAKHLLAYEATSRLMSHGARAEVNNFYGILSRPVEGSIINAEHGHSGSMGLNFINIDKTALKNPISYALYLRDLVAHELTHHFFGPHNEEFTSQEIAIQRQTAEVFPHILKIAEAAMGEPLQIGEPRTRVVTKRVAGEPQIAEKYLTPEQSEFIYAEHNQQASSAAKDGLYYPRRPNAEELGLGFQSGRSGERAFGFSRPSESPGTGGGPEQPGTPSPVGPVQGGLGIGENRPAAPGAAPAEPAAAAKPAPAASVSPLSKVRAGQALRKLVAFDRGLVDQLAGNSPFGGRLNEEGTRIVSDIDSRSRGPGTGGSASVTTDFINWLLSDKVLEGIAPDSAQAHMADVTRARNAIADIVGAPGSPETIVATAVRNPATGQIVSGKTIHVLLYPQAGLDPARMTGAQIKESSGYLTSSGRFVGQDEGQAIAQAAKQIRPSQELMGEAVRDMPEPQTGSVAPGPGAMTSGGPYPYPPVQQLTDRLNALPPVGAKERLRLGDRMADAWAQGKTAVAGALARVLNVGSALRATARGIRDINDVDRSIGSFQLLIQESLSRSLAAARAMERQMPNQTAREASALLAESTPQSIGLALSQLPPDTTPSVRRAMELAANPTQEVLDFLEDHKRFFQLREQDAKQADIFEQGLADYFTHIWGSEANMPGSVRSAIASGKVSTFFRFGEQRQIPTLLEGILAGKTPVLDPAKVVPFYNYSLDRVIASREFVRRLMDLDDAGDGRPIIQPAGAGKYIEPGAQPDPAILVTPRATAEAIADYKPVDHPALQQWKWVTKTPEGAQVFVKGDARVHPAHAERLSRMMDRGRLTPTPVMQAALRLGTEVKGFKLGLLSAFHNVHVGSHAAFHWTNPFRAMREAISFDDPFTRFAVEKGYITLAPSPEQLAVFSEGLLSPGLIHKVPVLGPWSKAWSEFTFGTQIPRLKLATFRNAFHRNIWARDHLPGFTTGLKGLSDEQIAARVGDSVNNAFGELNHAFLGRLGRSPEFQRALRLVFLAPDFGEARLRFVGKAVTKTGFEERLALATMFASLYTSARVGNWLSHGDPEWDWRRAFSVRTGNHWWSMRSVVGDLDHALSDFGRFMYVRLNPVYSRTISDMLFGRDISGKKLTWPAMGQRLAEQVLPIQLGGLTRPDQKLWESFITAMGGSTYRDTPQQDVTRWAQQWLMGAGHEPTGEFIPSDGPTYAKLRAALRIGSDRTAKSILDGLMKTHRIDQVVDAMKASSQAPFTRSRELEGQFVSSLSVPQQNRYAEALQERQAEFAKFLEFLAQQ